MVVREEPKGPCLVCRYCEVQTFVEKGEGYCRIEWACGPKNNWAEFRLHKQNAKIYGEPEGMPGMIG